MDMHSHKPGKGRIGWLLILAVIAIGFLPAAVSAVTYVSSPMVIDQPGEYLLVSDILNYDGLRWQNGTPFYEPVIKITASDVIFNGQGHTINGAFNQSLDDQVGIYVEPGLERVSVMNTRVNGFNYGIMYYGVNPFALDDGGGHISGNDVLINDNGIFILYSAKLTIENNTANLCNFTGIDTYSSHDLTIHHNTANQNQFEGIELVLSWDNTISDNTANLNSNTTSGFDESTGIMLLASTYNTVEDNTANQNFLAGITVAWNALTQGSPYGYNTIQGNTVTGNGHVHTDGSLDGFGIFVALDDGNYLYQNHASENIRDGINLTRANNNELSGNIAEHNGVTGIELAGSSYNQFDTDYGPNEVMYNQHGIQLQNFVNATIPYSSDNNELTGNLAHDNSLTGIFLNASDLYHPLIDNTLTGNDVYSNPFMGISFRNSNSNTLTENIIRLNGVDTPLPTGVGLMFDNSAHNIVYNNIFNNTRNAGVSGQANGNTWNVLLEPANPENIVGGPFIGGNYWATPAGNGHSQVTPDILPLPYGDGICDTEYPVSLDGLNIDFYPLANNLSADFTGSTIYTSPPTPPSGPAPP